MKQVGVTTPSELIERRKNHADEEAILKQYLDYLRKHGGRKKHGLKVQTVRNHLKAISSFYTYNVVRLSLVDFGVYKIEV
jgi:hypothetical protein